MEGCFATLLLNSYKTYCAAAFSSPVALSKKHRDNRLCADGADQFPQGAVNKEEHNQPQTRKKNAGGSISRKSCLMAVNSFIDVLPVAILPIQGLKQALLSLLSPLSLSRNTVTVSGTVPANAPSWQGSDA
jgi:hypothetical protein